MNEKIRVLALCLVGCLAELLTLVLLVGASGVLFTDVGCHGHAANARKQPDPLDVAELHRFAPPDKFGHWISRSRDCVITLDGTTIQTGHP